MLASFMTRRTLAATLLFLVLAAPSARGDELDYLPNGTFILYSLDVAAGFKSKIYTEMKERIPGFELGINEVRGQMGIDPKNIARMVAGAASFGNPEDNMIVLTTIKPVSAAEIKAAKKPFPFYKNYKITESKIGKHTVYEESYSFDFKFDPKDKEDEKPQIHKGQVFCVVEDNVVLYSRMDSMKKVLERNQKPKFSAGVAAGLKEAGVKSTLTVLLDLEALPERDRKNTARDLGRQIPGAEEAFENLKYLTLKANAPDKVSVVGTVTCKDAASAADTLKLAEAGLVILKGKLKIDPDQPEKLQDTVKEVRKLLDAVKLSAKGAQVRGEVTVDARAAVAMIEAMTSRGGAPPKEEFKEFKNEKK
ncbi:MAG: hypothetical protein HYR84_07645 [Planctomycetes bacterium]|nr:hypothetical protein [Planctomycetota bacterium]